MQVVALIHERIGIYAASFPDFPGCTATANDPAAVITKAAEVLAAHIERIIDNGHELPPIRSLSRLAADPDFVTSSTGCMMALVAYRPTTRAVRLAVTLDESLLARIDRAAETAGQNRSTYLADAARQRLDRDAANRPDATIPAMRLMPRTVEPPLPDPPPAAAEAIETAASLASIKEILERLDSSRTEDDHSLQLRPAKRSHL